jgi:hypothetical protein
VIDIKPISSALAILTQVHEADLFDSWRAKGEMVLTKELVAKHFVQHFFQFQV